MKKRILFLGAGLCLYAGSVCGQGYNIRLSVPQMSNKNIILANYFEGKIYAVDTAKIDARGNGAFRKTGQKLSRGMYLLLFSPSNYFDLIIGDHQNFSIATDTADVMNKIRFEGSAENQGFLDFQKFMTAQNQKTRKIRETFDKDPGKEKPETKEKYTAQFNQADQEVRAYVENLKKQFPGSALATFADFTLSANVPDFSKEVPEGTKDRELEIQRKTYLFEKQHYWDHTNFKDSTLIRTPIFKSKLDTYFNKMLLQQPDTIYREGMHIIEKSRSCKAMFRYLISYCFNFSLENKIMGMDEAFVKFAKRYYLSGEADWVDKEMMKKIEREVALTQYNLVGMKAQELKLPTLDGGWVSLYETNAPFTLLLFWESDCGHCKTQVPQMKRELLEKFKPYGLKVFAVHTQNEKEKWEKFVAEHDLFDFINCWDPHNQSNFRLYYHVDSTPVMYLLDKNKKIIAKKLDIEQFTDMLKHEYKKMGIEI